MGRAVITGVGVVSSFGVSTRAFFEALSSGRGAVGPIRSFDASSLPVRVAAEVPVSRIDAEWILSTVVAHQLIEQRALDELATRVTAWDRSCVFRDRKVAFGLLAALEAWKDAGCDHLAADLSLAVGLEQALLEDFGPILDGGAIRWDREATASLPPVRFRTAVDVPARVVTEALGLTGSIALHTSACAAGALSIAHAAAAIERGTARVVLCGATDSMINPLGVGGMARLGAPSPRNAADACRPFDRRRDGLAMGEGAAMFVVEDLDHAVARGAKPLARILGWGSTEDAYKVTAPRPDGSVAARAMKRAISRAGLSPQSIGYINAHGTGTPLNDPAEVRAIRDALGPRAENVAISSIKGAIGHCMAASGALEIAACLLPFASGVLPGTAHHSERDPECDLDIVGAPRQLSVEYVLSNSFGFGGQNATVALGRCR